MKQTARRQEHSRLYISHLQEFNSATERERQQERIQAFKTFLRELAGIGLAGLFILVIICAAAEFWH